MNDVTKCLTGVKITTPSYSHTKYQRNIDGYGLEDGCGPGQGNGIGAGKGSGNCTWHSNEAGANGLGFRFQENTDKGTGKGDGHRLGRGDIGGNGVG